MLVLSIDPGPRNFALAVVRFDDDDGTAKIMAVRLVDVHGRVAETVAILDAMIESFPGTTDIIVERQQPRAYANVRLQTCIESYACCRNIPVKIVSPRDKTGIDASTPYRTRKSQSVANVDLLMNTNADEPVTSAWSSMWKRDDVADAVLQALFFANKRKIWVV
jgi:Poxvirus A22 protein